MFNRLREGLRGFVERISKVELTEENLEPILWDLQLQLIGSDVALSVAERLCKDLAERLKGASLGRFEDKTAFVGRALREAIEGILVPKGRIDLLELASKKRAEKQPLTIVFIGINGTGKTTTIGKVTRLLQDYGYSVVLACSDTHRAGAIEQLEEHARRLGVRVIKHQYGADPAAVGFDTVKYAAARGIEAVLIDTAGRMQTNRNLMEELKKIRRVVDPDLTVLIIDALTGNDAVEQAEMFDKLVGFDAIILTKVDADPKGGVSLSITYVTEKPVIYIGTGQGYGDLKPFDPQWFLEEMLS
ncbi:MAG: signal recognition particle-docking protein FtsY [Candidatus Bathyarchaeia archaeon]